MNGRDATLATVGALVLGAMALRCHGAPLVRMRHPRSPDTSLGIAHEGTHRCHMANVACSDFAATLVGALGLAWLSKGSVTAWLVVLLVLGEALHFVYGIPTATQRWLWGWE